eukprot:4768_1
MANPNEQNIKTSTWLIPPPPTPPLRGTISFAKSKEKTVETTLDAKSNYYHIDITYDPSETNPNELIQKIHKKSGYDECVICMDKKRKYICIPCGHFCLCIKCREVVNNKCPICRSDGGIFEVFQ